MEFRIVLGKDVGRGLPIQMIALVVDRLLDMPQKPPLPLRTRGWPVAVVGSWSTKEPHKYVPFRYNEGNCTNEYFDAKRLC
jgi:hypothetical protein